MESQKLYILFEDELYNINLLVKCITTQKSTMTTPCPSWSLSKERTPVQIKTKRTLNSLISRRFQKTSIKVKHSLQPHVRIQLSRAYSSIELHRRRWTKTSKEDKASWRSATRYQRTSSPRWSIKSPWSPSQKKITQ